MTNDPYTTLRHLEVLYTGRLQRARMSASLSSKIRAREVSHCSGALEALERARHTMMSSLPLPDVGETAVKESVANGQASS